MGTALRSRALSELPCCKAVVRKSPRCELVAFAREPDEMELLAEYGDDLVAVVPIWGLLTGPTRETFTWCPEPDSNR